MDLEFSVNHQTLTRTDSLQPVADSINYLYTHFTFSDDWAETSLRTATFVSGEDVYSVYLDENDKCLVPTAFIISGSFSVCVFAEDDTPFRIPTNNVVVWVEASGYIPDGGIPEEDLPTLYEQVLAKVDGMPRNIVDLLDVDTEISLTTDGQLLIYDATEEKFIFGDNINNYVPKTSTLTKIITRTIAAGENISAITWTKDDDDNDLALLEVKIKIFVPANGVTVGNTAYVYSKFNDVTNNYGVGSDTATGIIACLFRSIMGYGELTLSKIGTNFLGFLSNRFSDGISYAYSIYGQGTKTAITTINKIYLYLGGATYFPTGTIIEVYGRTE